MLAVVNDDLRVTHYVHQLYLHRRSEEIFTWLYRNRITGRVLFEFVKIECKGSSLHAMKAIIARIDKEKETKPIFRKDLR